MNIHILAVCGILALIGLTSYFVYNHAKKSKLYGTVEVGISTCVLLLLFLVGLFRGFNKNSLNVDLYLISIEAQWINSVSASFLFTTLILITGTLLYREISTNKSLDKINSGEKMTAIVAVYKDGNVLDRSVKSLLDSNYDNLEIIIAHEPNDENTIEVANDLSEGNPMVSTMENEYPGSKSGAIRTVVDNSESNYFAVFDADEIIKEDFISTAMHSMHVEEFDVFQGRRIPDPSGIVESLAYCERIAYHASYTLVELSGFSNCRSSSTAFTRECFEEVDGYDDMLTEDLAFAHKVYRHDLSVRQCRNYTSIMEAPHTMKDFWGQRKRWRMGQVEVLHQSLCGNLTDGGVLYRRFISIGRMMTSMLGSVILITMISKLILLLILGSTILFIIPIIASILVTLLCAYRDEKNGDIEGFMYTSLMSLMVYPIFSLIMVKSFLEYIISWDGYWYHVDKKSD